MRFVIVTGMSGAGKSIALKILEDLKYYCVDNLPIPLMKNFAELLNIPNQEFSRVALGLDIRNGRALKELETALCDMQEAGYAYKILFLDASDEILIKRYKETRRNHPLADGGRINSGIELERSKLAFLKEKADYIIDTSTLLTRELKRELERIFVSNKEFKNLFITILSFGFKNGIPSDADLVFDVRFLPNPYYVSELKNKTGNDKEVQDYVMETDISHIFLRKLVDMVQFLIPNYIMEGKNQLVIAIGCTGGKHRSVTLANKLYEALEDQGDYGIKIEHRDIERDSYLKS